jgi:hypothetical protein
MRFLHFLVTKRASRRSSATSSPTVGRPSSSAASGPAFAA